MLETHIEKPLAFFTTLLLAISPLVRGDELDKRIQRAEAAAKSALLRQYASDIALAQVSWQLGKLDRAVALLQRHQPPVEAGKKAGVEDYRGIEWHLLWRMTHAEKLVLLNDARPVRALAFLPDDSQLITGDGSHTYATPGVVRKWSLQTANTEATDESSSAIWTQARRQPAAYTYFTGISALALTQDGKWIAVNDDKNVQVIDRQTGEIVWTFEGHTDFTAAVAISPDGKLLASAGLDKVVNLWSLETGEHIESLAGHGLGVLALAFSPDGSMLAAGGGDDRAPNWSRQKNGELKLWKIQSDAEPQDVKVSASVASLAYSADRRWLAVALFDSQTLMLDAHNGEIKRTLELPSPVECVCFSPDSMVLATASADGLVTLWDVESGAELATLRGHRGPSECLAFSHDGRTLASGGADRTLRLWHTNIHPERTRIRLPAWSIHDVAFTSTGQLLMASDYTRVWLIDAKTNYVAKDWPTNHWTHASAIGPDGSMVVTAGDKNSRGGGGPIIRLWSVDDRSQPKDLETSLDRVIHVEFSKDGLTLIGQCCNQDRSASTIRLYDVHSGEVIQSWAEAYHASYSPDGRRLALAKADQVELYDIQQKQTVGKLTGDDAKSTALQFSPDGTQLATGSFDRSVHLWNLATREVITTLVGHSQIIEQLLFSPDGKCLLVSDAIETKLWDLADATVRFTIHDAKCPMTFTPDGKTIITAPGEVHFWQVATGDELLSFPHYGYDSRTLALSPDGKTLAQAGGNRDESNGVWVWQVGVSEK